MPEEPTAPADSPPPRPVRRVPSARRFAVGAIASFVAVFGVLALRVHDGDDPALAGVAKKTTPTTTTSTGADTSSATSSDPYASSDDSGSWEDGSSSSSDSGSLSSTPGASTGAS